MIYYVLLALFYFLWFTFYVLQYVFLNKTLNSVMFYNLFLLEVGMESGGPNGDVLGKLLGRKIRLHPLNRDDSAISTSDFGRVVVEKVRTKEDLNDFHVIPGT